MDILVYIIVLGLVFIAGLIGFFIVSKKNRALSNKKVIFYYLAVGLVITACGFIALVPAMTQRILLIFPLLQLFFLGLGFLVFYLWKKNTLEEFQNKKSRWSSVLFISVNAILGMIGFTLLFYYCGGGGLAPFYALSVIPFVLPQFLHTSFEAYKEIPQEIYKVWYFPVDGDDIDPSKIDLSVIYMLELEYSKSVTDPRLTNTKLRAPIGMNFGDWFRAFVEDHNYKHDMDPIHYLNEDQTPQGWMFYVKPSFLGTARYIDPDLSITQNKLIEKRVIVARRVGFVDDES